MYPYINLEKTGKQIQKVYESRWLLCSRYSDLSRTFL